MPTKVYYNNIQVTGEPFVSRSIDPIDYGDRWGMAESITLNGLISGLYRPQTGVTDDNPPVPLYGNPTGMAYYITDIFKQNFKELKVVENGVTYYDFDSVTVQDISFSEDKWGIGTPIKYSVKLKAHDVFYEDAVIDPEDSYSFTENEDGSVTVVHKVSAKGIKSGNLSPLQRAITFVDKHKGINHIDACTPFFIPNKTGILINKSENINRLEGTYSIQENYKYNVNASGNQDHLKTTKLNISQSYNDDYHIIDYEVDYHTDAAHGIGALRYIINDEIKVVNNVPTRGYEAEVANQLNISAAQVYQASLTINEDPAANKIQVRAQYQTGISDLSQGIFEYTIETAVDEITDQKVYSLNGNLVTYGNYESKKAAITRFKNANYATIEAFLKQKVLDSQVFKTFGHPPCPACDNGAWDAANYASIDACRAAVGCYQRTLNPYPRDLKWKENPERAELSISATFSDGDWVANIANAKWSVQVNAGKHLRKEIPSANINGVFVLQDLNCETKNKTKITVNGDAPHGRYTTEPTQDANFNWKSADILTHEAIRNMGYSLASLIVPDNPVFYNNPIFTKEQTDNSEDASFPYTHSINLGYLHSNTIDNFNIHDHLARYGGGWNVWWKLRGPGFKFGH